MRARALSFVLLVTPGLQAAELPSAPAGVVADSARLFSTDERAKLEAFGADVLKRQGVALRVLTIADAGGEDPKGLAVRALNAWQVGPKSVLLLLVMNPRALYLQPGTALARSFDAPSSSRICSMVVAPQMRLKAYGSAALAGFGAIRDRVSIPEAAPGAPPPMRPLAAPINQSPRPSPADGLGAPLVALLVLGFPVYWILAKLFARKCPQCSTRMGKTTEVIRAAGTYTEGTRQILYTCYSCNHSETEMQTLPPLGEGSNDSGSSSSSSSSSGGSSSSSSDGSGGGGSSW